MLSLRRQSIYQISLLIAVGFIATLALPLAAEPKVGKAKFSLYYVAEVEVKNKGGVTRRLRDRDGNWSVYRLSPADARLARMQGTVSMLDGEGNRRLASIVRLGEWARIPKGWEGRGSRMNPLVPYRAVAADLNHHPYGSRVFIPPMEGLVTRRGEMLDGWMWVGDVGGGVEGPMRFDIFVGREACYWNHIDEGEGTWKAEIQVEHPPKLPARLNPRKPAGVQRILSALGYVVDTKYDAMKKSPKDWKQAVALGTALSDFQRQHPAIPPVEFGTRIGAITQWYLHQAASAVLQDESYAAKPGGPELPSDPAPDLEAS
jgi:3D (Asp-Asp-Asp) domain-containing protein